MTLLNGIFNKKNITNLQMFYYTKFKHIFIGPIRLVSCPNVRIWTEHVGSKREREGWKKLHNNEIHNLFPSSNIISTNTSRMNR
jgi:hypothetical protein